MVSETFWGLIGVAGVIGAAGLALWIELRKNRGGVENMLNYLRNSTMGNVDEKIAVLYSHANNVQFWRIQHVNIDLMISQISSDLSSIARVRNNMTWEQWRELHKALIELRNAMKTAGIDTLDIDAIREALR